MRRTLKTVMQLAAEGPFSSDQIRWYVFHSKDNGLESSIVRVGRRVYIDTDGFDMWLQSKNPNYRSVSEVRYDAR